MKTKDFNVGDWGIFILYIPLLAILYFSSFSWLVTVDWSREEYSYCYFIPFVFLYLIIDKREAFSRKACHSTWNGCWFVGTGILLYWLGELGGEFYSQYMSFWFLITGICWTHWGWRKMKVVLFPLFFLLTLFPPPNFIYAKISVYLKLLASQIGAYLMQLFGLSVYREGNIIDLGFTQLQVVDACSGLRFLNSLVVLGLLIAYFSRMALWKKIVVVISTVPLAVITNSFRIYSVGMLYKYFGAEVAEGFFHDFSGWVIFVFSLILLLFEVWILQNIFSGNDKVPVKSRSVQNGKILSPNQLCLPGIIRQPQFWFIAGLLVLSIFISSRVEFREEIPVTRSFADFPQKIGDWSGLKQDMEQIFLDELDLSDYLLVDYVDSSSKKVNFYVAYYESQRKGESIHSPETCLPGSGWVYKELGNGDIVLPGIDRPVKMNRALIVKGNVRQLSYFWFSQRGRILTNAYQLKLYTFLGALTQQRTDGALVRIITPVYESESLGDADERLKKFIFQVEPVLAQFLPHE